MWLLRFTLNVECPSQTIKFNSNCLKIFILFSENMFHEKMVSSNVNLMKNSPDSAEPKASSIISLLGYICFCWICEGFSKPQIWQSYKMEMWAVTNFRQNNCPLRTALKNQLSKCRGCEWSCFVSRHSWILDE